MGGGGYWTPALLMRLHGASASEVGLYIGLGAAIGGLVGTTTGGSSRTGSSSACPKVAC